MNRKLLLLTILVSIFLTSTFAQEKNKNRSAQCCENGMPLKEFLYKTTRYPTDALEKNLQGRVIIDFTVGKDGTPEDFVVVEQFDEEGAECAIAALKASRWSPEIKKGKPVKSKNSVIIYFKLRGADTTIDIEPGEDDIIIWGYGTTKVKSLTIGM